MNWSALPLFAFAALNVLLAILAPRQASNAAGVATLFGVAAALILLGVGRNHVPLLLLGLVCALLAPLWMGRLMYGRGNVSHHIVRALIVALFFSLWLKFRPV